MTPPAPAAPPPVLIELISDGGGIHLCEGSVNEGSYRHGRSCVEWSQSAEAMFLKIVAWLICLLAACSCAKWAFKRHRRRKMLRLRGTVLNDDNVSSTLDHDQSDEMQNGKATTPELAACGLVEKFEAA